MKSLAILTRVVVRCERCPRLRRHCQSVARETKRAYRDWKYWGTPVPGFGDPRARLLIVGLAPGAHGSNRTGRMFTGDASGDWLYDALYRFGFANQPASTHRDDGLALSDCFITAAARCAPPGNKPTPKELENCRPYLEAELRLLPRIRVVLTLGRVAFEAYLRAVRDRTRAERQERSTTPVPRPAFTHGAAFVLPGGVTLLASYHPSRQNTNTGKLKRAMWYAVFRRASQIVNNA
ncbi:MAG: uracil-DNA glycosylase [Gemmatimonadetes bacterium]|nr:uracil-DNA glycosylase [Gemmatimonadota bacterium]